MGNAVVAMLPPYYDFKSMRSTECIEWCARGKLMLRASAEHGLIRNIACKTAAPSIVGVEAKHVFSAKK